AKTVIKYSDEVLHEILHALAFNTLLSSQETDAFSGVRSFFRCALSLSAFPFSVKLSYLTFPGAPANVPDRPGRTNQLESWGGAGRIL
ncbi:hypothetical protein, partial [Nonomuraea typhae]